jgi:DNA repair exonuclease SbcCD ATPase subunit
MRQQDGLNQQTNAAMVRKSTVERQLAQSQQAAKVLKKRIRDLGESPWVKLKSLLPAIVDARPPDDVLSEAYHSAWSDLVNFIFEQASTNEADALRAKLDEANRDTERLTDELKAAVEDLGKLQDQQKEIVLQLTELDTSTGGDTANIEALITGLDATIKQLTADLDAARKRDTLDAEALKCTRAIQQRGAEEQAWKDIEKALKTIRAEELTTIVEPFVRHINEFLQAGNVDRVAFCRLAAPSGRHVFQFGWCVPAFDDTKSLEVLYDALSGGEKALFGAAVAYALTMLADPPCKVLMLEGGELDAASLFAVMCALKALSDNLDNVILATHYKIHAAALTPWDKRELAGPQSQLTPSGATA